MQASGDRVVLIAPRACPRPELSVKDLSSLLDLAESSKVQGLCLQGHHLSQSTSEILASFIRSAPFLRWLDLGYCVFEDEGALSVVRACAGSHLVWLDLTFTSVGQHLGMVLKCRSLRVLSIRFSNISPSALSTMLRRCPALDTLDARCCALFGLEEGAAAAGTGRLAGLSAFSDALAKTKKLKNCLLQGNGVSPEEQQQLRDSLGRDSLVLTFDDHRSREALTSAPALKSWLLGDKSEKQEREALKELHRLEGEPVAQLPRAKARTAKSESPRAGGNRLDVPEGSPRNRNRRLLTPRYTTPRRRPPSSPRQRPSPPVPAQEGPLEFSRRGTSPQLKGTQLNAKPSEAPELLKTDSAGWHLLMHVDSADEDQLGLWLPGGEGRKAPARRLSIKDGQISIPIPTNNVQIPNTNHGDVNIPVPTADVELPDPPETENPFSFTTTPWQMPEGEPEPPPQSGSPAHQRGRRLSGENLGLCIDVPAALMSPDSIPLDGHCPLDNSLWSTSKRRSSIASLLDCSQRTKPVTPTRSNLYSPHPRSSLVEFGSPASPRAPSETVSPINSPPVNPSAPLVPNGGSPPVRPSAPPVNGGVVPSEPPLLLASFNQAPSAARSGSNSTGKNASFKERPEPVSPQGVGDLFTLRESLRTQHSSDGKRRAVVAANSSVPMRPSESKPPERVTRSKSMRSTRSDHVAPLACLEDSRRARSPSSGRQRGRSRGSSKDLPRPMPPRESPSSPPCSPSPYVTRPDFSRTLAEPRSISQDHNPPPRFTPPPRRRSGGKSSVRDRISDDIALLEYQASVSAWACREMLNDRANSPLPTRRAGTPFSRTATPYSTTAPTTTSKGDPSSLYLKQTTSSKSHQRAKHTASGPLWRPTGRSTPTPPPQLRVAGRHTPVQV
eukprot:Hpha_TRINITY_DN15232_c2_g1::TRINITY_DN15232_c2_g1_i1::g.66514::m.66514